MYHWLPRRIETHVKICVLALLIERVAELACGEPWGRICYALEKLQLTNSRPRIAASLSVTRFSRMSQRTKKIENIRTKINSRGRIITKILIKIVGTR